MTSPAWPGASARILLSASEDFRPAVEDVGLFFTDLTLLHDLFRLAYDPQYSGLHVSRYILYRHRRPLPDKERLQVVRLSLRSPLELLLVAGGVTLASAPAIKALVQAMERVYNLRASRRRIDLENERLGVDTERLHLENERLLLENEKLRRQLRKPGTVVDVKVERFREPDRLSQGSSLEGATNDEMGELIAVVQRRLDRSPMRVRVIEFDVDVEVDPKRGGRNA
jgi:hypothetical protein